MAVDDWNLDAFRELDDQPALPFDAAAPAEEPARQSRCTSCGDPADATLCVACERAFRLSAQQTIIERSPVAEALAVSAVQGLALSEVEGPRALAVDVPPVPMIAPVPVSAFEALAPSPVEASPLSAVETPVVSAVEGPTLTAVETPVLSAVEPPVLTAVEPAVVSEVEPPRPVLTPTSLAVTAPPLEELFAALEKVQRDASAAIASTTPVVDDGVLEESQVEDDAVDEPVFERPAFEQPALDKPAVVALAGAASDPFASEFAFRPEPPRPVADTFDVSEFAIDVDQRPAPVVEAPPDFQPAPAFAAAPVFEKAERAIAEAKGETTDDELVAKPVMDETAHEAWLRAETTRDLDVPTFDQPSIAKPVVESPVVNVAAAKAPVVENKPAAAVKPAAKPVVRETAVISAPVSSGSSVRYIGVAAAIVLVIGAIGIPMGRMFPRSPVATEAVQTAPAPVARTSTPSPAPAPRVEKTLAREAAPVAAEPPVVAAPSRVVESPKPHAAVALPAPAPAAPVAATASPDRVEPKPAAPPRSTTTPPAFALPPTTTAIAPGALSEAPAEPVAVKPAPPAAPEPVAAAPRQAVPPSGPFYEAMDVDEAPQVATRVEPSIAADVQAHLAKEIVIVRVLVSEAGHPVLVRLLRGSRAGRALDAAIVASVQQWTFTPASKRGQRVTCWLHTAVTIGR